MAASKLQKSNRKVPAQVSFKQKKQFISDLYAGIKTVRQIADECGVHPGSVYTWKQQVLNGPSSRTQYNAALKRKVAWELSTGILTLAEAKLKYGIRSKTSILNWVKEFSGEYKNIILPEVKDHKEQEKETTGDRRREELEEALANAHLKITSLETLIDVAEKELNINIRKKSGSKQ